MAVKVKICGLTNLVDAQVALDAGADYLGFIFHPKSPRYVTPETVAKILTVLDLPPEIQSVGVFVNSSIEDITAILEQTSLKLAQLHGDEPTEYLARLEGRGFKAVRPTDSAAAQRTIVYTSYPQPPAPALMLDAYHPTAYGGTGLLTDWSMAAMMAQSTSRLLLAGGLTAANVRDAIAAVAPGAVGVSSGVERAPGQKDHEQVRAFIVNAKGAA